MKIWMWSVLALLTGQAAEVTAGDVIGAGAVISHDSRQDDLRYVTWHPVEGQVVTLNPPRFRWPYDMDNPRIEKSVPSGTQWDFQIASDRAFQRVLFKVSNVACNFYNDMTQAATIKRTIRSRGVLGSTPTSSTPYPCHPTSRATSFKTTPLLTQKKASNKPSRTRMFARLK